MVFVFLVCSFSLLALLFVWYKKVDADLTLTWHFHQDKNDRGYLQEKYKGRVIWITGASSGIGEEVAYAFSRLGARLAISGTRADALEKVKEKCTKEGAADVLCVPFNVANYKSHQAMLDTVIAKFGELNVLVNNAGRLQRAEFVTSAVEVEKELFEVNVFGIINVCRVAVKHWQSTGQQFAQLFVTSSAAGKMGSPFSAAYAGSKHALHGYLETLRDELSCAESPITITLGCPGPVKSNLRANALTEKVGERYTKSDGARKLMDTGRCASFVVSGIGHKLDELWIADQPLLTLFYVYQYLPSVFRRFLIRYVMTKKQVEQFRKGE